MPKEQLLCPGICFLRALSQNPKLHSRLLFHQAPGGSNKGKFTHCCPRSPAISPRSSGVISFRTGTNLLSYIIVVLFEKKYFALCGNIQTAAAILLLLGFMFYTQIHKYWFYEFLLVCDMKGTQISLTQSLIEMQYVLVGHFLDSAVSVQQHLYEPWLFKNNA